MTMVIVFVGMICCNYSRVILFLLFQVLEVRAVLEGLVSTVEEHVASEFSVQQIKTVAAGLRSEYLTEIGKLQSEVKTCIEKVRSCSH
jgi:hypothetical protein